MVYDMYGYKLMELNFDLFLIREQVVFVYHQPKQLFYIDKEL